MKSKNPKKNVLEIMRNSAGKILAEQNQPGNQSQTSSFFAKTKINQVKRRVTKKIKAKFLEYKITRTN